MKTTTTISKILMVSCLFLIGLTFTNSKVQAKSIRTEMVLFKNNWIPKVQLKEVKITANAIKPKRAVLCQIIVKKNKVTPFVQLAEITVTPNGNFKSEVAIITEKPNSILVENKLVDGKFIPHVNLKEVTIVADNTNGFSTNTVTTEVATNNQQGIIQVSVRKTFDRLANFLVSQSKIALRKLMPSWFAE